MIPFHFHLAVPRTGKVLYSTSRSRFIPITFLSQDRQSGNLFQIFLYLCLCLIYAAISHFKIFKFESVSALVNVEHICNCNICFVLSVLKHLKSVKHMKYLKHLNILKCSSAKMLNWWKMKIISCSIILFKDGDIILEMVWVLEYVVTH